MKGRLRVVASGVGVLLFLVSAACLPAADEVYEVTLTPGESSDCQTLIELMCGRIDKADVIFAFDTSGSMGPVISTAKSRAIDIMNALEANINDAQYGVMSFVDYPDCYVSCRYDDCYGDSGAGDYPYRLNQPVTANRSEVAAAINRLSIHSGLDLPEAYTRALYESYADTGIGYRSDAQKIVIMFGDSRPHDCEIRTGQDPGRDQVMGTADDLSLRTVMGEMVANGVTLLYVDSGDGTHTPLWNYLAGLTGGAAFRISRASQVPDAVLELVGGLNCHIDDLRLTVMTPGYEAWLSSVVPEAYTDIDIPAEGLELPFDCTVTVPRDACDGIDETVTHEFLVSAIGDGVSYKNILVRIHVPCEPGPGPGDECDEDLVPNRPGSILVFPLIDNRNTPTGNNSTIVEITNVGDQGVWLHSFIVASASTSPGSFVKKDFFIHLTAKEPFYWDTSEAYNRIDADGVLTQISDFDGMEGFMFVWAVDDRVSPMEIDYDQLMGNALVFMAGNQAWDYNAIPHQALSVVGDGILNLDGVEYAMAPGQIMAEGFSEGIVDDGKLVICSLDIDFILSIQPEFNLNIDIWNQNEVGQSRHMHFIQFQKFDFGEDLQATLQHIFTPKWHLAVTGPNPVWAVYYQTKSGVAVGGNVWHRGGSGVPAAVVLPPIPDGMPGSDPSE